MICDLTFISQTGSFTLQSPRSSCTSSSNTRTWISSSASAMLQVNRGSTLWSGTGGTSPSLEQV